MKRRKIWLIIFAVLLLVCTSVFVYQNIKIRQYKSELQTWRQQSNLSITSTQSQNAAFKRRANLQRLTGNINRADLWRFYSAIPIIIFALLSARIVYKQRKSKNEVQTDQLIGEIGIQTTIDNEKI